MEASEFHRDATGEHVVAEVQQLQLLTVIEAVGSSERDFCAGKLPSDEEERGKTSLSNMFRVRLGVIET